MIFNTKCDSSIKGVLLLAPFMLAIVNLLMHNGNVEEIIVVLVISVCISLFIMKLISATKYIVKDDCLMITGFGATKKIAYKDISGIYVKKGRLSIQTPSIEQLWLMKDNIVIAQLSPLEREKLRAILADKISG